MMTNPPHAPPPPDYRFDVSKLEPVVAAPHSPDNRKLARECSDVKIDRVYIGWAGRGCVGQRSVGGWVGV